MIYFKYRTLDNWPFLLDILLNSRLYAASFEELNDPMEGFFRYDRNNSNVSLIETIANQKKKLKICSLSGTSDNNLMWSYYANGHQGIVIELEFGKKTPVRPMDYTGISDINDMLHLSDGDNEAIAREVLSKKEPFWKHENEYRIITTESYVSIVIKKIIIGTKAKRDKKALLKKLLVKLAIPYEELELNNLA